jgi:hypothetical protein
MGIWTLTFVCLQHELAFQVTPDMIHLDSVPELGQGLGEASLWAIEYECAQQGCGLRQTIFAKWSKDAEPKDVVRIFLNASPEGVCREGHSLELAEERVIAIRLND